MWSKLRRFDVQARFAAVFAAVSVIPAAGSIVLAIRNFERELGKIVYGQEGYFVSALLGCVIASILPAGVAFVLGLSSLGKRRNDAPGRSWIGFFVGGSVLTANFIVVIAFWMLRLQRPA